MKKIFVSVLFLLMASHTTLPTVANAASLAEFAGDYEVSSTNNAFGIPVQGKMSIDSSGKIEFLISSTYLYLNCVGVAEMKGEELVSTPACENGLPLTLKINLSNIKNYSKFQAPVFSSIINQEMLMDFTRL